jgi:hypothetical protein
MRCAFLTDEHIRGLVNHAKHLRRHSLASDLYGAEHDNAGLLNGI